MNNDLEDEILSSNPPYELEKLDRNSILDDSIFNYIISINNASIKVRKVEELKFKAKELGVARAFNSILKQKNQEYVQNLKAQGGNKTEFTDCPYEQLDCGSWTANDAGVYKVDYSNSGQPYTVKASPIPVTVVERLVNIDTNIEKVKIAFYKDEKWQEIIAEKNTISSKAKILQLANRGLNVNEDNAKNLITYLSDLLELNKIKIKKRNIAFGLD